MRAPPTPASLALARARQLYAAGDRNEARTAEQAALTALTRDGRHRPALAALAAKDSARAQILLDALLRDDPGDVVAMATLGNLHASTGDIATAESLLRRAVTEAPGYGAARVYLAALLRRTQRPDEALAELDQLPVESAAAIPARTLRADCLGDLGRLDEQVALLDALIADTGDARAFGIRQGHALRALGRNADAEAAYRSVLASDPADGASWWSLANLKTVRFDDTDLKAMETALAEAKADRDKVQLHFALGRALEERGDPAAAFAHYDAGNRLRAASTRYDPAKITQWVDRTEATFTADFFAQRAGFGDPSPAPIFVVGMQRSGSTLIEQILATHPSIEGTAELPCLPAIVRQLGAAASAGGRRYEDDVARLDSAQCAALGNAYRDAAAAYRTTDRPYFVDKMPNNWMHVSLIRLILPNATIIDVRRDPMDCGFANWRQFYARGLDHADSLDTMGRYYADYVRLMRHIDRVQPGAVHRVLHDRLVADPEGEMRRLFAGIGIPFDPAVLDFHRTERAVRTISASQVRKPVNRDGVGRWRAFEQWLDPLAQALGDARTRWDETPPA